MFGEMKVFMIVEILTLVLVLLYLLMIMPRIIGKPDTKEFRKWLYAHRGLFDNETDAPENSMKAFRRAMCAGYGIELDVQLCKDLIPVVFHDATLNRICKAEGKISDYSYEELQQFTLCNSQEHIPKLEDVLKLVNGKVPLIVELKTDYWDLTLCTVTDRMMQKYQGLYCIESFNPLAVLWYHLHRNEVVRGQLADNFLKDGEHRGALYFALQHLLFNFLGKPDFIAYNHKYQGNLSRRLCHGWYRNMAVAWTVKNEEELAEAKKHFDVFIFDSFKPKMK